MNNLQALEAASRLRNLAKFYGEAAQISVTRHTKSHYGELCSVCEMQAYRIELATLAAGFCVDAEATEVMGVV